MAWRDFPSVRSLTFWRMNGVTSLPVMPLALGKLNRKQTVITFPGEINRSFNSLCHDHKLVSQRQKMGAEKPTWQQIMCHKDFPYLASVTAVCIACSISWPAAACSSGMGTANRTPLWRPSDRMLAEPHKTNRQKSLCWMCCLFKISVQL